MSNNSKRTSEIIERNLRSMTANEATSFAQSLVCRPAVNGMTLQQQKLNSPWIEQTFKKCECSRFEPVYLDEIPSMPTLLRAHSNSSTTGDPRCGCGRKRSQHTMATLLQPNDTDHHAKWSIMTHTKQMPTDAYGSIEFMGGSRRHKARYVRLAFDTPPENIVTLFDSIWQLKPPRLVITVHGGIANFKCVCSAQSQVASLQPKLEKAFKQGLLKAGQTTGAWIITNGG